MSASILCVGYPKRVDYCFSAAARVGVKPGVRRRLYASYDAVERNRTCREQAVRHRLEEADAMRQHAFLGVDYVHHICFPFVLLVNEPLWTTGVIRNRLECGAL